MFSDINEKLKPKQEIVQNKNNEQLKETKKEEKENQNKISFGNSSGNDSEKIEIININKEREKLNQIIFDEEIITKKFSESEKKFNVYEESIKSCDELSEVDKYYNNFMECLQNVAQYKILDDENLNSKNINVNSNSSKKIKVYGDYEILNENKKYATFLKLYVNFKIKREKFRNLLDYVKDLKYLEKIIKEEKEILKYLFGYLENLVRCYNRDNLKCGGGVRLEYFNSNNEFYCGEHYDSKCEDAYPVKFKYDIYDAIGNFYDVEIKKLEENLVGDEKLKLEKKDEKTDFKKEKELNYEYEVLFKKNDLYYNFIAHLNFDAIFRKLELFKKSFYEIYDEIKCKNEEEKFYKLQFMFRKLRNHVRILFQNISKSDEVINYLKKEEGMLRKIYDLIIDFLPNQLKEKEKFVNAEIENFNDEEMLKIKDCFRKAVLREIVRVKNEPISFKKMHFDYDKKFPVIFRDYKWENSEKNAICWSFDSVIDDVNFNSIFKKIDDLVDEYGNLKKPVTQQSQTENEDSTLAKLYKNLNQLVEFYLEGVVKFHERLKVKIV